MYLNRVNINILKSKWMDTICRYSEKEYLAEVKDKFAESIEHKTKLNKIYDFYLHDFALGGDFQDWRYNIFLGQRFNIRNQSCWYLCRGRQSYTRRVVQNRHKLLFVQCTVCMRKKCVRNCKTCKIGYDNDRAAEAALFCISIILESGSAYIS